MTDTNEPSSGRAPSGVPTPSLITRLLSREGVHLRDLPQDVAPEASPAAQTASQGRYQIYDEIARGGIGIVLNGRDGDLGRGVAVKVLQQRYREDEAVVQRFIEEAQIGGQLQHPGIVPVYDLGVHDDCPFFAMKLIRGRTLRELLSERADLRDELPRILTVFEAVCQTVGYAHARGVVHRDLKPDNVMVGQFGEVQVVDWGIAKVLGRTSPAVEASAASPSVEAVETVRSKEQTDVSKSLDGEVMGTPAYMPPEQARGDTEHVDERSDVFGLGAILCQVLTGEPPFRGELIEAAMGAMEPVHARLRDSGADDELVQLACACLAEEQADRPADAKVVAERVAAYRAGVEERAQQALLAAAEARVRARATTWIAVAVVAAIAVVLGGWAYLQSEQDRRQRAADARVDALLDDATAAAYSARAGGWKRADLWRDAVELASIAADAAGAEDVSEARRSRAQRELQDVRGEQAAAREVADRHAAQQAMVERLEVARIPTSESFEGRRWLLDEAVRLAMALRAAFSEFVDLDLLTVEPAVAADALRSEIRVQLATSLDLWALAMVRMAAASPRIDRAQIDNLRAIAQALDPDDSWRSELRAGLRSGDANRAVLTRLAQESHDREMPAASAQLLAEALLVVDAGELAMDVYRRAHAQHPNDFGMCYRIGILHGIRDDWPAAISYLRVARGLRPGMLAPSHMLGVALTHGGRPAESLEVFERLSRRHPGNGHLRYHVAAALYLLHRNPEARAVLEEVLAVTPDSGVALALLAQVVDRMEGRRAALPYFRNVVATEPRSPDGRAKLATALRDLEEYDEAVAQYRAAMNLQPTEPGYAQAAAVTLMKLGRPEQARDVLFEAVKSCKPSAILHITLGDVMVLLRQFDRAGREYERASELGGPVGMIHYGRARVLRGRGRLPEAIAEVRAGMRTEGAPVELDLLLVRLLTESGEPKLAAAHAQLVIAGAAPPRDLLRRLGSFLADHGRPVEGEQAFRRMMAIYGRTAVGEFLLGNALNGQNRMAESSACFRRALQLDPRFLRAHCNLASVLEYRGRHVEALAEAERLLARKPDLLFAHEVMVGSLVAVGRLDDARRTLANAQRLLRAGAKDPLGVPDVELDPLEKQLAAVPAYFPALRAYVLEQRDDFGGGRPIEAAAMALRMARYRRAVQLFELSFAPGTARPIERMLAARSALLAQAEVEGEAARRALRDQAFGWLQDAVGERKASARQLRGQLFTGDFDVVIGEGLATLPADERSRWGAFWRRVAQLASR